MYESLKYWINKQKIYLDRRDKYAINSIKWSKYNMLYDKATYNISKIKFEAQKIREV